MHCSKLEEKSAYESSKEYIQDYGFILNGGQ